MEPVYTYIPKTCECGEYDCHDGVWCKTCNRHHNYYHADFSAICCCGCRCTDPEMDQKLLDAGYG